MKTYSLIETWVPHNDEEGMPQVTSRHETVFSARQARAKELGLHVTDVCGRRFQK